MVNKNLGKFSEEWLDKVSQGLAENIRKFSESPKEFPEGSNHNDSAAFIGRVYGLPVRTIYCALQDEHPDWDCDKLELEARRTYNYMRGDELERDLARRCVM